MKKFGSGSSAVELGYDMDLIISWLEDMVNHEAEKQLSKKGQIRLEKAETALALLYDIE